MKPLLEVRDLSLSCRGKRLVQPLCFSIDHGERAALVGPSGSGKSLTLSAIARLLPPQIIVDGKVYFKGIDLLPLSSRQMRPFRREGLSCILQESMSCLNPSMKIERQIREVTQDPPECWLEAVEIPSPRRTLGLYPHQCSGGMCQRISIAIALAAKPQLLLADEITSALDSRTQDEIIDLLDRVCKEFSTALLLVTHDMSVAERLCSKLLVMEKGLLVEEGPLDKVVNDPCHECTRKLIRSALHVKN